MEKCQRKNQFHTEALLQIDLIYADQQNDAPNISALGILLSYDARNVNSTIE